jgi:hypothetical protein
VKIQEYIASGIIESYVLGLASPEEIAQMEGLLPLHPELREALSDFGYQLELFALENEVPPPPGVREKILDRIREMPVKRGYRRDGKSGRNGKDSSEEYIPVEHSSTHIKVHKYWRPAFIVIFILSKILLALAIYYFIQYQHNQNEILQLKDQLDKVRPSTTTPGN